MSRTQLRGWAGAVRTATGLLVAALVVASTSAAFGAAISKTNNTDNLNLGSSWVGGVAPGPNDVAVWDNVVAANTVSLGADLGWLGMRVDPTHTGSITVNGANTLTLGSAGFSLPVNITVTFNNALILATNQTWNATTGQVNPWNVVDMGGYTLALSGGATKQFKGAITGGGTITVAGGAFKMTNPGATATGTAVIATGATVNYDTPSGVGNAPRTASLKLNGGTLTVGAISGANIVETNLNALTIGPGGLSTVSITPNTNRNSRLYSGSFARNAGGGVVNFRGTRLGVSPYATPATNSANVVFGTPPTLVGAGGGAGSTTGSILLGAYADTSVNGLGMGLATYDETYGIRLLDLAAEYTPAITSGQSQLDNVRYVNTSGSGVITTTLSDDTTINSLSINETGIGTNSGVVIVGDSLSRQLVLSSGAIFAQQAVGSAQASDAMVLTNLTLNLNGREGVFITFSAGSNQGNTPAPLYIYGVITNDGGNGITIGGSGQLILAGNTTNVYTGPTTVNSGVLRLNKPTPNTGVPGDLVVNGGTVLKNSESLPDTADLTLNGGNFYFDTTTSSGNGGNSETVRNLTLNGGAFSFNSGNGQRITVNGNAIVTAGDFRGGTGGRATVLGTTTLNGGRVLVTLSSVTNVVNAFYGLNSLVVSNTVSGVYTAVVLKAHNANKGGILTLNGDVTVVGNSANTNSVWFDSESPALTNQGLIALNGVRTFTIEDGAAVADLTIASTLDNNGITNGGLVKAGAGTLALTGASTYTGPTTVGAGLLTLAGSLACPVTVSGSGLLDGTGSITSSNGAALTLNTGGIVDPGTTSTVGTLTVTGNVVFAGGRLQVEASNADGADLLSVSGNVTASVSPVTLNVTATGSGPWKVMTAANIVPDFVASDPEWRLMKVNGNTELWLSQGVFGTAIIIR